jgi:hypothetical protein
MSCDLQRPVICNVREIPHSPIVVGMASLDSHVDMHLERRRSGETAADTGMTEK